MDVKALPDDIANFEHLICDFIRADSVTGLLLHHESCILRIFVCLIILRIDVNLFIMLLPELQLFLPCYCELIHPNPRSHQVLIL